MTQRRQQATAEPSAPIDDWENLKSVASADAANGYAWDFGVVFLAYVTLRLVGAFRAPFGALGRRLSGRH